MIEVPAAARAELAPWGVMRVAVNIANPATVTIGADDSLGGPCIDLANALARALNLPFAVVRFASAGEVVAAEMAGDAWDVAFLAVDPARAERLHFSPPYLTIEAAYAVPAASPIGAIGEIDRAGVRIATSKGAAYDLHLQRTLRLAQRCPFADPATSFAAFAGGGYDAVAGLRPALERRFGGRSEARILPGHFLAIRHAVAVPVARRHAADIIDRMIATP